MEWENSAWYDQYFFQHNIGYATDFKLEIGGIAMLAFGGTSLLIVIGVALETVRELEAQMTLRNYKGFLD